jgi:1-acyl-sn-glycerol-3-phosphate acyltransferase
VPPFHWWRTVFFLIPVIGICTVVLGILSLLSTLVDHKGRFAHRCARWWARAILVTSRVRIDRQGVELPPARESCVFVANHASFYDIPILFTAVPRQLRIVAKASLGRVPFIGWHLHRAGHLLVDRDQPGVAVFTRMRRMPRDGVSLIVFPEGARTLDGAVGRFKRGTFLLAVENGWPIVPISVSGSRTLMPRGRLMVRPATVRVTVHEAIPTSGLGRGDARGLASRVRDIVASAVQP